MAADFQTHRISPKNQVTLPKGAKALADAEELDGFVCGTTHRMTKPETGEKFRVVVLMTEGELHKREEEFRTNPQLSPEKREAYVARLNGNVQRMAIDAQRRIVLPKRFVDYLGLGKEAFMVVNKYTVVVWQPEDWHAYIDTEASADEDDLPLMMI